MAFQENWPHTGNIEYVCKLLPTLEMLGFTWVEEPVLEFAEYAQLKAFVMEKNMKIKIAGCEGAHGGFNNFLRPWLQKSTTSSSSIEIKSSSIQAGSPGQAPCSEQKKHKDACSHNFFVVDIMQPDVSVCGGLSVFVHLQRHLLYDRRSSSATNNTMEEEENSNSIAQKKKKQEQLRLPVIVPHGFSCLAGTLADMHFQIAVSEINSRTTNGSLGLGGSSSSRMNNLVELSPHVIAQAPDQNFLKRDDFGNVRLPQGPGLGVNYNIESQQFVRI